jgi:hypothetical protein
VRRHFPSPLGNTGCFISPDAALTRNGSHTVAITAPAETSRNSRRRIAAYPFLGLSISGYPDLAFETWNNSLYAHLGHVDPSAIVEEHFSSSELAGGSPLRF